MFSQKDIKLSQRCRTLERKREKKGCIKHALLQSRPPVKINSERFTVESRRIGIQLSYR